jgi:hypothetical protein
VLGSFLLSRERSAGARQWRLRQTQTVGGIAHSARQVGMRAAWALGPALLALANPHFRHWLAQALGSACVIGGFFAAPLLTLVAWLGLMLPARVALHQASTTLFAVALIWVVLAVLSAHVQANKRQDKQH